MNTNSLAIVCLVLFVVLIAVSVNAYQNPFENLGWWSADPCVFRWMGKYYLYYTMSYNVFESEDLVNWSNRGRWASTDVLGTYFWAPEVFYYNGVFYMYWSNPYQIHTILTSSSPLGPFQVVDDNAYSGIDGDVFMDDDGQLYFVIAGDGGIWYDTMNSPTSFAGSPSQLTSCVVELPGEGQWTEGAQIFKIDGDYYMTYCGTDYLSPTYQIHAAQGDSVATLSPQGNNPIIANPTGTWTGTGHNYVFLGPDLITYYTFYHALSTSSRKLMLDRLWVNNSGNLCSNGPTFHEQPNPELPDWSDAFDRTVIGPDWSNEGGGSWTISTQGSVQGDSRGQVSWARLVTALETAHDCVAEFHVKLVASGTTSTTPQYGVVVGHETALNGLSVFIDPSSNRLSSHGLQEGIDMDWNHSSSPPTDWDHTQWHVLRVKKIGTRFKVFIDEMLKIERELEIDGGKIGFILEDCQADFGWTAFSNCYGCVVSGVRDELWRYK